MINWNIVAMIVAPIITLLIGIFVNRALERRSKLIAYFVHVSAFKVRRENTLDIYTHSIVVRNTGRRSATNVRLGHSMLPDFNIFPSINHSVGDLPDGTKEIVIPTIVPGEEIRISYLYFPPMTWQNINTYIKSDEGFAKKVNMLQTPKLSKGLQIMLAILLFVGTAASIYILVLFLGWLIGHVC